MMPIAHMVEGIYKLLGPCGMKVPRLIPSRIRLLSCSRSFNCSKAKERLGYMPIVSLEEGLKKTIDSFSHSSAENLPKREGPSKASIYLGNGRIADTLLWKDIKQTMITLLVLVTIYYSFIASQCTIISTLTKLLLVASVFLFIPGNLPEKALGYNIEKFPQSCFYLSKEKSQLVAHSVASTWNAAFDVLHSLCKGNDWILFLKVIVWLLILSVFGSISIRSIFIIGLPVTFVAFYVYEKNEPAIDAIFSDVLSYGSKLKSQTCKTVVSSKKIETEVGSKKIG